MIGKRRKSILRLFYWLYGRFLELYKLSFVEIECEGRFIDLTNAMELLVQNWPQGKARYVRIIEEVEHDFLNGYSPYTVPHFLGRFTNPVDVIKKIKQLEIQYDHNKKSLEDALIHNEIVRRWIVIHLL